MAKSPKPFTVIRRTDSKSFRLTLNPSCGLPDRVCKDWYRRSLQHLPEELSQYRNLRTKSAAEAAAVALIAYLKKMQREGGARRVRVEDITVGAWIEKFTAVETSPRTGINAFRNRPYSLGTVETYRGYFNVHIKGDPFTLLKMVEVIVPSFQSCRASDPEIRLNILPCSRNQRPLESIFPSPKFRPAVVTFMPGFWDNHVNHAPGFLIAYFEFVVERSFAGTTVLEKYTHGIQIDFFRLGDCRNFGIELVQFAF